MVSLTGQVATNAPPDPFQGCPAIELTKHCTKFNHQLNSIYEFPSILDYAKLYRNKACFDLCATNSLGVVGYKINKI